MGHPDPFIRFREEFIEFIGKRVASCTKSDVAGHLFQRFIGIAHFSGFPDLQIKIGPLSEGVNA